MSDPLRVAVAAEGPTDVIVLGAVLDALLAADVEFRLVQLQPEGSAAFGATRYGDTGLGWGGVYRWSRQSCDEGGGVVSGSSVFDNHDLLIVHVDADVATKTYASAGISDAPSGDLPCNRPCPPANATTNALRAVVLKWLGETSNPPNVVMCTPSMKMDAWVVSAVWPENRLVHGEDWECRANPDSQLATLPLDRRFRKSKSGYHGKREEIAAGWRRVAETLTEAGRFQQELLSALRGRIRELTL